MDTTETRIYTGVIIATICFCVLVLGLAAMMLLAQRRMQQGAMAFFEAETRAKEEAIARMAADLHDQIGAILYAVILKLGGIKSEDNKINQPLMQALEMAQHAAVEVKRICRALQPQYLEQGLEYAIRSFLMPLQIEKGISIHFDCDKTGGLPEKTAIHLYRITQEIVHNCLRHSQAKTLKLQLLRKRKYLYLLAEDDGVGFHKSKMKERMGLGLANIYNRVAYLGGTVRLITKEGKGCRWEVRVGEVE